MPGSTETTRTKPRATPFVVKCTGQLEAQRLVELTRKINEKTEQLVRLEVLTAVAEIQAHELRAQNEAHAAALETAHETHSRTPARITSGSCKPR